MLDRTLPGVPISAEHYPPSLAASAVSGVLTLVQWTTLFGAFGGQAARSFVEGTPLSELVVTIQENRLAAAGGAWFLLSSLSASMLKTGAFEVEVRDEHGAVTVWSGIKRGGRPPATMQEMHAILDALRAAGVGLAPTTMAASMSEDDEHVDLL